MTDKIVIKNGSTTHQVYELLKRVYPRYMRRIDIVKALPDAASPKCVDWALNYLGRNGALKSVSALGMKSPLYLTYQYRQGFDEIEVK